MPGFTLDEFARLAASHFALVNVAYADAGTEMNSFFNDAGGAANVTGPAAFQGQSAGYYSLGNVWTRFPQKSVSPFNLQLPSARAGCGGIDLFSGSFSFINASEIVAMLNLTDQQRVVRQEMISRWMRDKEAGLRGEIGNALHEPTLVSVAHPVTADAADVTSSYHPHGTATLPPAPASSASARAGEIIEAGRIRLDDDRAAAAASRTTHVGASVDVQEEVHRGQDKGFFLDPKLRQ